MFVPPKKVNLWFFSDCREDPVYGNPQRMGPINKRKETIITPRK